MPYTPIDPLPAVPSTASPSNFATVADAFLAALNTARTQANALAAYIDALLAGAANVGNATSLLGQTWANTALTGATTAATLKAATTIGVGNATPSASGAGVSFPAAQLASTDPNTLDDYEEGTWTPVPTNLAVVGTPTYAGTYSKVGNRMFCTMSVTSTTSTASTGGSTYFTGLPFSPAQPAVCFASGQAAENRGTGLVWTDTHVLTPTWAANGFAYIGFSFGV